MNSDLLLSNWIFVWFVLYLLCIIPYSPKLIILAGFGIIVFMIIYLYIKNASRYNLLKFIILNILMKIIPLIVLYNIPITENDYYFSIAIFIIYLFWLDVNETNIVEVYQKLTNYYINGSSKTLVSNAYDNIYKHLM